MTTPSVQNPSSPASACQEDPIKPLRASSNISFTVESYLPLFHCPIFPEFIVLLVHISIIVLITLLNMLFRYLVPQNGDFVIFESLV